MKARIRSWADGEFIVIEDEYVRVRLTAEEFLRLARKWIPEGWQPKRKAKR